MKKLSLKKLAIVLASVMILSSVSYAEDVELFDASEIGNGFKDFSTDLMRSAPSAAMQQNIWSDAYIGTIFPGLKFGFGSTTGVSSLNLAGLNSAMSALEGDSSEGSMLPNSLVLPVVTVDFRLGGIIFPFDVGFSIGMLKPSGSGFDFKNPSSVYDISDTLNFDFGDSSLGINYLALGFDVRYCLYDGFFDFSVGAGYYHLSSTIGFGMSTSGSSSIDFEGAENVNVDYNVNASFGTSFSTDVLTAQCQISKSFLVATVFAGGRLSISSTKTSWGINAQGSYQTNDPRISDSGELSQSVGETYTTGNWFKNFQPTVYAGASLNLLVFQLTANVGTDIGSIIPAIREKSMSKFNWSGALSFHVKL